MSLADAAESSLKNGDVAAALAHLQEQVREQPSNAKLRIFLFQLLCVRGEWERALNQLKVATELDARAGDGADVRRSGALRGHSPRRLRRQEGADGLRRAGAVAGAPHRIAARRQSR